MRQFDKEMERWEKAAKEHLGEMRVKDDYKSSMDSKYYFSAGKIGATTSPQVANQIGELNSRLNQGLKAVEIGTLNQRLLDQVPKEHFTEIKRMSKLTGAEPSLHAPIQDLDLAGFTQHGWDPTERKRKVKQLGGVIERAHLMDPEGNIPITIHAGTFPAQKWQKEWKESVWRDEEGKPVEDKKSEMMLINPHSGEITPVRYRERHYIGREGPVPFTPERQMDNKNITSWDQEKFQLLQWKKQMNERDDMRDRSLKQINYNDLKMEEEKGILSKEGKRLLDRAELEIKESIRFKGESYQNMRSAIEDMNERLEKYHYKKGNYSDRYNYYKKEIYPKFKNEFEKTEKELEETEKELEKSFKKYTEAKSMEERTRWRGEIDKINLNRDSLFYKQTENALRAMEEAPPPQTWRPVEDFAKGETSSSLAEAAVNAYRDYGKNSPMLLLENVYPEFALSRADALKSTIKEARDKFVEMAIKKEEKGGLGLSKNEAIKHAEKVIGVTWDVGHIYMLKKSGYSDKDIKEEAEKIAPYVKHLHLTDNFGFEDSHLPPGLGEVNIKEQLKAMEKIRAKEGTAEDFRKVRGIVEAGEFVANYKEVPHLYALAHLGSPMYSENAEPYWHQAWDTYGNYFGSYGELLPQKYFDLYGAPGFSQLPAALGGAGSGGGEKGRFASSGSGGLTGEES